MRVATSLLSLRSTITLNTLVFPKYLLCIYVYLALLAPYADFLRNTSARVLGTWDDHDYGVNDGGKEVEQKRERQQLFLDFLGVPPNLSALRDREGVYSSHVFGSPPSQTKVIMLDTRSFRDSHFIPSAARLGSIPFTAIFAALSRWATAALGLGKEMEAAVLNEEQVDIYDDFFVVVIAVVFLGFVFVFIFVFCCVFECLFCFVFNFVLFLILFCLANKKKNKI